MGKKNKRKIASRGTANKSEESTETLVTDTDTHTDLDDVIYPFDEPALQLKRALVLKKALFDMDNSREYTKACRHLRKEIRHAIVFGLLFILMSVVVLLYACDVEIMKMMSLVITLVIFAPVAIYAFVKVYKLNNKYADSHAVKTIGRKVSSWYSFSIYYTLSCINLIISSLYLYSVQSLVQKKTNVWQ